MIKSESIFTRFMKFSGRLLDAIIHFRSTLRKLRKLRTGGRKLSLSDLRSFGKRFAGRERVLVIHVEFPCDDLLPDADVLPVFSTGCERYFPLLAGIKDESYSTIIATGLVEHLKDPAHLVRECHRILKPGGKVFFSASSVFSVHRGPDDYFHVTRFGMEELMATREWSDLDIKGSSHPFRTMGILLQRILLQCETRVFIRPFIGLAARIAPCFDRFVINQYSDTSYSNEKRIDSMMPSNIQVIATK